MKIYRVGVACGLDNLGAALRLNSCLDQHDHLFVILECILDCSSRFSLAGVFTTCSAYSTCSANTLATISTATVMIRVVFICDSFP